MPKQGIDGATKHRSELAIVLVDVINDLQFPGGERLLPRALAMGRVLAGLRRRAHAAGVPVIYVNDNFGAWQSDLRALVAHCLAGSRGEPVVRQLEPGPHDYFVLKPKHSGFFASPLELLLQRLGARCVLLGGMAAESCVLATAHDAYERDYRVLVPSDCVASQDAALERGALAHMRHCLRTETKQARAYGQAALHALKRDGSWRAKKR